MKFTGICLAASCLIAVAASAQQPSTTLTYDQAVSRGLEKNLTLNQNKNQLAYTEVAKSAALLQLAPSVSASANAYQVQGNFFNQNAGAVVNGKIDYLGGSIDAGVTLFNGLSQIRTYQQAKNVSEAQLQFVNRSTQDVIRNVAFQYLTCLLDQQLVKINEQNLQTQQTQYEQIKAQVALGSRAEADLYNQEYQVKNAELLLVRSRNTLSNDKATLAQTILWDPAQQFSVEEVAWDIDVASLKGMEFEQMITLAIQNRSDLRRAEFQEKAAQFGYLSRKGQYFPSLSAGASLGSRYNYQHDADNDPFDQQFYDDNRQFSYGVSLNIPIFNGLANRSLVALAKVNYENARVTRESAEVIVKNDVILAYQNFNDAALSFEAAQSQLRAAELSYKTEKERYDLGISDIVQLTTSNQAYVRAQSDFFSARYTLMFQKLLMDYALGTLRQE